MQPRAELRDYLSKKIINRIGRIVLGYVLAILVATIVTIVFLWPNGGDLPILLMIGTLYTALTATAPALLFIIACERLGRPGPWFHAGAGVGTALVAHIIFSAIGGTHFYKEFPLLIMFSCIGGAAGAWSYWKIAVAPLQARDLAEVF